MRSGEQEGRKREVLIAATCLGNNGDDGDMRREGGNEAQVDGLQAVSGDKVQADVDTALVSISVPSAMFHLHGVESLVAGNNVIHDGVDAVGHV